MDHRLIFKGFRCPAPVNKKYSSIIWQNLVMRKTFRDKKFAFLPKVVFSKYGVIFVINGPIVFLEVWSLESITPKVMHCIVINCVITSTIQYSCLPFIHARTTPNEDNTLCGSLGSAPYFMVINWRYYWSNPLWSIDRI